MVKFTGTFTIVFAAFCIFATSKNPFSSNTTTYEIVDQYYLQQLKKLKAQLLVLKKTCQKTNNLLSLKQQFKEARLTYKHAAVLIEYFNLYDAQLLNGPAIARVEEDHPDKIIEPTGFQVMEQLIFEKEKFTSSQKLSGQIDFIISVLSKLETEPDHVNKFSNEAVFDAMQLSIVRMMTLGIAGFDSPLALYSLPETKAGLEGVEQLLNIYKTKLLKKDKLLVQKFYTVISQAKKYLDTHQSFNNFDRLSFITGFLDPLYTTLIDIRKQWNYFPAGLITINYEAKSIFEPNGFNYTFFSPNDDYRVTEKRIQLGQLLFNDPALSGTGHRSCATCHKPEKAFTDGFATALSIDDSTFLTRNTPTLWNSGLQTKQFYDSRVDILENQFDEVLHNSLEMKGSLKTTASNLKQSPAYTALFTSAYPGQKEAITPFNIANAISSYQRSLIALNSRFDKYMRGDKTKLNSAEKNGFNLFMGKAKCGTCHFMPLFNGLLPPQFTKTESEVIGVPKTKDTIHPILDDDPGKFLFTGSEVDKFSFKTPTIRNIELTGPYMHNGVYTTLEEILNFYNKGGGKGLNIAPEYQTLPFDKLSLSPRELKDIIAFMKTLTDTTYNKNLYYR